MKLFDTLIKPIITYGSEVWISDYKINLTSIDQLPIEQLQHKMHKQVLGVNRKTSNLVVRMECCRYPIIIFCISLMYKYFIRIRNMPQIEYFTVHLLLIRNCIETNKKVGTPIWL